MSACCYWTAPHFTQIERRPRSEARAQTSGSQSGVVVQIIDASSLTMEQFWQTRSAGQFP